MLKPNQAGLFQNLIRRYPTYIWLCGLTICATLATTASAEVLVESRYEHYLISPAKVDQIKTELRQHSPVSREDQVFHGGTEWKLIPHFRWKRIHRQCHIQDVMVRLQGTYTLPKLRSVLSASPATRKRFDAYYDALLAHEEGHQALWEQAGRDIEALLIAFAPQYDCDAMAEQAKQQIAQIIARYQEHNQAYDLRTGHGKTQGAAIR